jgi:hypothetical protein
MNDHELRAAYERLEVGRGAARESCVAPEDLMRLAAGLATEAERLTWLEHVAACRACRADLDVARAVADAGRGLERPRIPAWLALAASVLLVVGGVAVWRTLGAPGDVLRGADDRVTLVAPIGTVAPAAAGRLVWRALPEATFEVEVLDANGTPVLTATTTDTGLAVPPATLDAGVDYRWRVTARMPDGSRRRSTAEPLRVRTP